MSLATTVLSFAAWTARRLPMSLKRCLYRTPLLARLIRGGLNAAAPDGLSETVVAAGALKGYRLLLDLQKEKHYWLGVYEPELQAAASDWVKPGWTVYDVGANIGYTTLLLARAVGEQGRIFAFEALPDNLERLRANVALNGLQKRVTLVPSAVIDGEHPVRFLVGPTGEMGKADGSAGRKELAYRQALQVPGISLDWFVSQPGRQKPQIIKMDIEGGEVLALPGMRRLLRESRPLVFLEQHGPESAKAAWDTFLAAGYSIRRMEPGYPVVASLSDLNWKDYLIAVPPGFDAP